MYFVNVRKILVVVERVPGLHIMSDTIYISKEFWIEQYTATWFVFFDLHSKLNMKQIYEITPKEITYCLWKGLYNGASVIRTPIIWTLHLQDERYWEQILSMLFCISNSEFQDPGFLATGRCYNILPIRRKTLSNQSINPDHWFSKWPGVNW